VAFEIVNPIPSLTTNDAGFEMILAQVTSAMESSSVKRVTESFQRKLDDKVAAMSSFQQVVSMQINKLQTDVPKADPATNKAPKIEKRLKIPPSFDDTARVFTDTRKRRGCRSTVILEGSTWCSRRSRQLCAS
jgi:hypothetical protein